VLNESKVFPVKNNGNVDAAETFNRRNSSLLTGKSATIFFPHTIELHNSHFSLLLPPSPSDSQTLLAQLLLNFYRSFPISLSCAIIKLDNQQINFLRCLMFQLAAIKAVSFTVEKTEGKSRVCRWLNELLENSEQLFVFEAKFVHWRRR
jgi:hypothetical protein